MLILNPTSEESSIKIIPRSLDISGEISFKLRRDGDGLSEHLYSSAITSDSTLYKADSSEVTADRTSDTIIATVNGDFVVIIIPSNILEEDSTYYLEIDKNGELWYRDKIYATSQTKVDMELNKHEIGNGTIYKTYDKTDDNTYII